MFLFSIFEFYVKESRISFTMKLLHNINYFIKDISLIVLLFKKTNTVSNELEFHDKIGSAHTSSLKKALRTYHDPKEGWDS